MEWLGSDLSNLIHEVAAAQLVQVVSALLEYGSGVLSSVTKPSSCYEISGLRISCVLACASFSRSPSGINHKQDACCLPIPYNMAQPSCADWDGLLWRVPTGMDSCAVQKYTIQKCAEMCHLYVPYRLRWTPVPYQKPKAMEQGTGRMDGCALHSTAVHLNRHHVHQASNTGNIY